MTILGIGMMRNVGAEQIGKSPFIQDFSALEVGPRHALHAALCTCRGYWSGDGAKSKGFVIVIEMLFD